MLKQSTTQLYAKASPVPMPTILLIDDDRIQLRVASYVLRKAGYQVISAENGADALPMLDAHDVRLVITDLKMPHLDGIGVLRHIRSHPHYRNLPVIVVTSSILEQQDLSAHQEGASAFLTKPTHSERLLSTVRGLLDDAHNAL